MLRRLLGSALVLGGILLLAAVLWMHHDSEGGLRARAAAAVEEQRSHPASTTAPAAVDPAPAQGEGHGQDNVVGAGSGGTTTGTSALSGMISIPSEDLEAVLRPSVSDADLAVGVGHYPGTAGPGEDGNLALAVHRGLVPDLDQMGSGDEVQVETDGQVHTYRWVESFVVQPEDVWVLDPVGDDPMLTITTCHPRWSNEQRLVVRLELVDTAGA